MTVPALRLRSICDLLSERFFVPTYQRGYRWTARQVEALLDDLAAFQLRERNPDAYYCLQPVVVRRRPGGDWMLGKPIQLPEARDLYQSGLKIVSCYQFGKEGSA